MLAQKGCSSSIGTGARVQQAPHAGCRESGLLRELLARCTAQVWMVKDQWGVWEVTLPDGEALESIAAVPCSRACTRPLCCAPPLACACALSHRARLFPQHSPAQAPPSVPLVAKPPCPEPAMRVVPTPPRPRPPRAPLPPTGAKGTPAIPHRSRVKVKMMMPNGAWVDRLPAWIKWVRPGAAQPARASSRMASHARCTPVE